MISCPNQPKKRFYSTLENIPKITPNSKMNEILISKNPNQSRRVESPMLRMPTSSWKLFIGTKYPTLHINNKCTPTKGKHAPYTNSLSKWSKLNCKYLLRCRFLIQQNSHYKCTLSAPKKPFKSTKGNFYLKGKCTSCIPRTQDFQFRYHNFNSPLF